MTIKELVSELNTLIEAGYGNAKAIVNIPTLYITEDGDISRNEYRHETRDITFSAKDYIKGSPDTRIPEIPLHDASWDECSYDDFWDDYKECEDDEGEDWIEE